MYCASCVSGIKTTHPLSLSNPYTAKSTHRYLLDLFRVLDTDYFVFVSVDVQESRFHSSDVLVVWKSLFEEVSHYYSFLLCHVLKVIKRRNQNQSVAIAVPCDVASWP